ncbi:MAG: TenA family transcriptional regulator [Nitrososphaerales archaeon]
MLIKRIDQEIEKRNLLKHSFYQMWVEGKLRMESLQGYAKEYFNLVKAVPVMVQCLAAQSSNENISENLREEREHIEPWINFAAALGVKRDELESYNASPKACDSVGKMLNLVRTFENGIAAMYAYEAEIPKISRSKIDGLARFYNITDDSATEYFRIHESVDIKHANVWRNMLAKLPIDKHEIAFDSAVSSLIAQNTLLDAVYENYVISM